MEIKEELLQKFIDKMEGKRINSNDLMFIIEELSYLAQDNGFDSEGFFDELIEMMNEKA